MGRKEEIVAPARALTLIWESLIRKSLDRHKENGFGKVFDFKKRASFENWVAIIQLLWKGGEKAIFVRVIKSTGHSTRFFALLEEISILNLFINGNRGALLANLPMAWESVISRVLFFIAIAQTI